MLPEYGCVVVVGKRWELVVFKLGGAVCGENDRIEVSIGD
jgi:hypothetical protein